MKSVALLVLLLGIESAVQAAPVPAACGQLAPRVQALLSAYSRKDADTVMKLTDADQVLVLGTDVSEVAASPQAVRRLMTDDFRLWGTATFGDPVFMSCRMGMKLGSAAFDVPFSMVRAPGHTVTVTVRFLTLWRRRGDDWLLTQSLNSQPTTGQSAADILKSMPH